MSFKTKRKLINLGSSHGVTIPHWLPMGTEATMAGNSLILLDPTGKLSPEKLLKIYEENVEPLLLLLEGDNGKRTDD